MWGRLTTFEIVCIVLILIGVLGQFLNTTVIKAVPSHIRNLKYNWYSWHPLILGVSMILAYELMKFLIN
jgi:hypothetical protein